MSFNKFGGIVQTSDNSSGAFALAAALAHVTNDTVIPNQLNVNDISKLYTQPNPLGLAHAIYQMTGNLKLNPNMVNPEDFKATYEYDDPVDGMNPPSALVYAATIYGQPNSRVKVFFNTTGENVLGRYTVTNTGNSGKLFDTEITLIEKQHTAMAVVGPTEFISRPNSNEAQLVLVNNFNHWLALSADQCYDPATGVVAAYTTNTPLNNGNPLTTLTVNTDKLKSYDFCGIWISLTAAS